MLRIAQVIPDTEAEGPGRRFALWVQGCTIRCKACCNPEMFEKSGGLEKSPLDLAAEALKVEGLEGVSILGGEPFEQAAEVAMFAWAVRARGLNVMVYSGYTLAEIKEKARTDAGVAWLLSSTDLLVDGRFEAGNPEKKRRWIGSANQEMHFFTKAYSPEDPRFFGANTVEVRLSRDGKLTMNGWPKYVRQMGGK